MKNVAIRGIIPPILTPMNEDESINVAELRNQVNRMIEAGCHALFPFGTNGEGYILSGEEKKLVLETVVEETNGRVPVYAGTGCISTRETIAQSKMARDIGADVLSIITPSFAAASQNELYDHYKAVAEAVDMPIVLYNIPARTGNAIAPATVGRLAQIEGSITAQVSELEQSTASSIGSIGRRLDSLEGSVAEVAPLSAYVRIATASDGTKYILIGNSSSPFQTKFTNEEIQFLNGDVKVAYVSHDTLEIMNANIHESLTFGDWRWKEEANGNLTLRYIG